MVFMNGKTAIDVKKKLYSMRLSEFFRKQVRILKILKNELFAIRIGFWKIGVATSEITHNITIH